MASTPFDTLTPNWSAANRFTASADTDILLSNPSSDIVFFALTTDDTVPAIPVRRSNPLKPLGTRPMRLFSGERLWIAGESSFAVIEA